ncbi:MAG: hypothetical protein JRG68_06175 [Deltaproteobacteria bacterium]|nr:hypothetical protein [Deltaproteobacteria bacterium]
MNPPNRPTSMDQKIFTIGLDLETSSVYLLCCGLADSGKTISTKNLLEIWNGTEKVLYDGLETLEKRNIIQKIISDRDVNAAYKLTDVKKWKF